jgi:hypothetical protein
MRTILSLAALATAFHPTARACGLPQLEIHRVALSVGEHWRTFVVFGDAPEVDGQWFRLAPHSYDNMSIAELAPEKPRTLTLVGTHRTTVVTASHRVALKSGWQLGTKRTPHVALEVPAGEFQLALDGDVADAKWHELEYNHGPVLTTDLGFDVNNTGNTFAISRDGKVVRTGQGRVRGFVDAHHERFVVVDRNDGSSLAMFFGGAD